MDIGILGQGDFDQSIVLLLAEDNPHGRGFLVQFHIAVEVVDVHLHLAEVAVTKLADFEVDQHIAAEQTVVEDQIDEEMLLVEGEALLPGFKQETFTQFQQEVFKFVDDGALQIGFGILRLFIETEEFQNIGFLEQVLGSSDKLPFGCKPLYTLLVPAEGEALIQTGIELALEFRQRPASVRRLDFVETALVRVADGDKKDILRPAQSEFRRGHLRNVSASLCRKRACRLLQFARWRLEFLLSKVFRRWHLRNLRSPIPISQKELAHVVKIAVREPPPEIGRQSSGEFLEQRLAVFCAFLAVICRESSRNGIVRIWDICAANRDRGLLGGYIILNIGNDWVEVAGCLTNA